MVFHCPHIFFFQNGAAPASASKRCIMSSFISFIQQRPAKSLTIIIQTEAATKYRFQNTTKLVQMQEEDKALCLATIIVDS
jgi:hypothetical protein